MSEGVDPAHANDASNTRVQGYSVVGAIINVARVPERWSNCATAVDGSSCGSGDSAKSTAMDSRATDPLLEGKAKDLRHNSRVAGRFDYWLNSHQIMHILVAMAMLHFHWGAASDYHTFYSSPAHMCLV